MRGFLLRRLATFVPTLCLVLIATFAAANLVPAVPVASESAEMGQRFHDQVRAFRELFGFDQPVFLNLRWRTTPADVRAALERSIELQAADAIAAQRAQDDVAELERFAVAGALDVALDAGAPDRLRDAALAVLPRAARLPAADRVRLAVEKPLTAEERAARVEAWRAWRAAQSQPAETGFFERARITFGETRFATYLARIARLDFGVSTVDREPVLPTLFGRLRFSLGLSLTSILLAYLFAVPLGVFTAARRGARSERGVTLVLFCLYSLPVYFAATLLLRFLTVGEPFRWFPTGGYATLDSDGWPLWKRAADVAWHLALPVVCLTYGSFTLLSRYVRGSMLEALDSDYVRTARAKGASRARVVWRHALRNALLPVLTLLGNVLPAVFSGAVIVEIVFEIPGMGTYIYRSIAEQDLNAILATTLVGAVLTLVGFLVSDVAYALADPRIRLDGAATSPAAGGAT